MNGSEPKIEIFKPFSEAFELMKKILFQPFDFTKWLVIGFAAFLANLSGGFHFNVPTNWNRRHWRPLDAQDWDSAVGQLPHWVRDPIIIGIIIVLFIALILICSWLGARGRFIFTDCIVKNRGAIVAPWHEFRKEANGFFLFALLISFLFMLAASLLALAVFVPLWLRHKAFTDFPGILTISGVAFVGLIIFLLALAWALISHFMLPVMYRRRCRAREAFGIAWKLIAAYPGEMILYCLFFVVLLIGSGLIGCVLFCATCCIAAIPYVGTVILLPIFVVLRSFSFCFLRQFGPDYDVWAGIPQPDPPPISSPPPLPMSPPLQT
jgi:hypothetical protein